MNDECHCGNPGQPLHPCPYDEEISGDDKPCNCCEECTQKCEDCI